MKVISLYQPYASLVVAGLKQYETRGWDTRYRGPLAIHATKNMPPWCVDLLGAPAFRAPMYDAGLYTDELPFGAIVGQVNLVRTLRAEDWIVEKQSDKENRDRWNQEFAYGDYSTGRFAWELQSPVLFNKPIPARGSQGFWQFDLTSYTHGQVGI